MMQHETAAKYNKIPPKHRQIRASTFQETRQRSQIGPNSENKPTPILQSKK